MRHNSQADQRVLLTERAIRQKTAAASRTSHPTAKETRKIENQEAKKRESSTNTKRAVNMRRTIGGKLVKKHMKTMRVETRIDNADENE